MDDLAKSAFLKRPDLHVGTEGEFAGWRTWSRDSFETHTGPFWHRMEDDGSIRCAFRVEKKHLNGVRQRPWRLLHDLRRLLPVRDCRAPAAWTRRHGGFACEFLDAAREGELIEGTGEMTRAGGSLIFLRGQLKSGERMLFTFSGTIKRVKRKPPAAAAG